MGLNGAVKVARNMFLRCFPGWIVQSKIIILVYSTWPPEWRRPSARNPLRRQLGARTGAGSPGGKR